MSKVVDLKNTLVNDYLKQKENAIQQIYALQKEEAITANEASTAVAAINAQAEVDVIDMTKTFYQEMFGMASEDFARTQTTTANTRNAVDSYLSSIWLTPLQKNQIINNYVKQWYTTEEAITKLSDDIRDGTNPVINDVAKNNADAAQAAQAKFQADMALKIQPIITKGEVDLQLQNDKQAFEANQSALDRQLRARNISTGNTGKLLTITEQTKLSWSLAAAAKGNGQNAVIPSDMTDTATRELNQAAMVLTVDPENKYANQDFA